MVVSINDDGIFIHDEKVCFTPLTNDYDFKPFDCGDADLNDFLINDSKINIRHLRFTTTITTILEIKNRIVAYYSLANDLLIIRDKEDFLNEIEHDNDTKIENAYFEQFFNETTYPAAKIGRLVVDKNFQGKGIGSVIMDSLCYSFSHNNKTGCRFITVDAINCIGALRFYDKHNFKYLTAYDLNDKSRAMYKPLINCLEF